MFVRRTEKKDFEEIKKIFAYAREFMRQNGNPGQWSNNRPSDELLLDDIEKGNSYCIVEGTQAEGTQTECAQTECGQTQDTGKIIGVFTFIPGIDPTYIEIEGGSWLNDEPYGTIHRMAGAKGAKGIFDIALSFCENLTDNIRVDTHHDNLVLQHLAEKHGFQRCGIIYVDDGTPRIAYHKVVR
ncbi:MAG: N-acetyltransferase [Clostridia bacterium]|nr:N-acetyltransferase [Clostridia bacterium]